MGIFDSFIQPNEQTPQVPGGAPRVNTSEPSSLKNKPINYASIQGAFPDKKIEVGNERLVLGDYEGDGYKMIYANLKSGQDAFGISPDRKTFCVTDGMSSEGVYSGDVARFLSHELTKDDTSYEQAFKNGGLESLVKKFMDAWKQKNGTAPLTDLSGHTTVSVCRVQNDGSIKILQLGDSPVYVKTKNGEMQSFGNENINDDSTGMYLGVTDGAMNTSFNLEKNIHIVPNAESLTIASDWLSDNYESVTKEHNERWIAKYEVKYPELKTGNSTASYLIKNEYSRRVAMRNAMKPFDPLAFKDIETEDDIQKKMNETYNRKRDDITVAMVNISKILSKG